MSGKRSQNRHPVRAARRRVAEWLGGLLIAGIAVVGNASVSPANGADEPLPETSQTASPTTNDAAKPASAPAAPGTTDTSDTSPPAADGPRTDAAVDGAKSDDAKRADAKPDSTKRDDAKPDDATRALGGDGSPAAVVVKPKENVADAVSGDGKSAEVPKASESGVEVAAGAATPTTGAGPRPLSVKPEIERQYPKIDYAARPRWVESMPTEIGTVHVIAVSSGPWESPAAAMERLDEELKKAADKYATELLEDPLAASRAAITAKEIRQRLATDDLYAEVIEVEVGRMHQVHARLQFDDDFRDLIRQRWREAVTRVRLGVFGTGFLVLFASLMATFGYFKLDTATRGYYSRRLQLLTGAAILGSVTAGVVLARHYFSL